MDETINNIYKPDGSLAQILPDYKLRQSQIDCTSAIVNEKCQHLILEAPTGSGKSFQNLIGTLLRAVKNNPNKEPKIIYVTSSKVLQDQLGSKDLKLVAELFKSPELASRYPQLANLKYGVLKGISNYACKLKLALADVADYTQKFNPVTGAVADNLSYEESKDVVMPSDSCLGKKCVYESDCYYRSARDRVCSGNIIVLNYHLFFSLLFFRQHITLSDFAVDAVIFDEAHNSASILRDFTEQTLDYKKLDFLARQFKEQKSLFGQFKDILEPIVVNNGLVVCNKEFASDVYEQAKPALTRLANLIQVTDALSNATSGMGKAAMKRKLSLLSNLHGFWNSIDFYSKGHWETVFFYADKSHSLSLLNIDLSKTFAGLFSYFQNALFIHSSATLMVNGKPKYLADQLGLTRKDYNYKISPPVFNYSKQCRAIVTRCSPLDGDHFDTVMSAVNVGYEIFEGKMLVLCTSIKAMEDYYSACSHPAMCQGMDTKQDILAKLRDPKNKVVVFATKSFFEGIDVKGDGLSCLILDKLPFLQPNDPLVKGWEQMFGNSFMAVSLPAMVLLLKQGFGRLIRHEADRGLFILCDNRVKTARYGKMIEASLPMDLQLMSVESLI